MGQIQDIFNTARGLFNAGNYDSLTGYLHSEAIFNEVDPNFAPHQENTQIVDYLKTHEAIKLPQLTINNDQVQTPADPIPNSASHGQVSGSGYYQDNSIAYMIATGLTSRLRN
jgi:hypothetical protein